MLIEVPRNDPRPMLVSSNPVKLSNAGKVESAVPESRQHTGAVLPRRSHSTTRVEALRKEGDRTMTRPERAPLTGAALDGAVADLPG